MNVSYSGLGLGTGHSRWPCSLAASLSTAVELLEGWVDATGTNRVRWGTRSTLIAALWHFPELEPVLGMLRSSCNVTLMEDQVDALWILARLASNLLAPHVLPSVTRGSPDGVRE
jgi:hypothetical protein